LRIITPAGDVACALLHSKARVAPKIVSIPRLELTAAVVSAEVSLKLKEDLNLKISSEYFWTDSQVVLGYLRNESRKFHTFVANRVQSILDKTDSSRWFYIPTDQNPADLASRGATMAELKSSFWYHGPEFLNEPVINTETNAYELVPGDPEVRAQSFATTVAQPHTTFLLNRLDKFSNWNAAILGFARLKRFVKHGPSHDPVTLKDKQETESFLIEATQHASWPDDFAALASNNQGQRN
jgi:hypothetical protein